MDIPKGLLLESPPSTLWISDAVLEKLGEDLIRVLYRGVQYIVTESQILDLTKGN